MINWVLKGGVVFPFGGDEVRINDKFYLGGPLSLRGFRIRGLGPATKSKVLISSSDLEAESLGGEIYMLANIHLMTPGFNIDNSVIPIQVKGQIFHNCGNLLNLGTVDL